MDKMNANHIGSPSESVIIRCLVSLKEYGFKPIKLIKISIEKIDVMVNDTPFRFFVKVRASWSKMILYVSNTIMFIRVGINQYCN